jgi:hypothetical protein
MEEEGPVSMALSRHPVSENEGRGASEALTEELVAANGKANVLAIPMMMDFAVEDKATVAGDKTGAGAADVVWV